MVSEEIERLIAEVIVAAQGFGNRELEDTVSDLVQEIDAGNTLPSEDKRLRIEVELLRRLLSDYRPAWWYMMGKEGYECNFCGVMVRELRDFDKVDGHRPGCAYIQARLARQSHRLSGL